MIWIVIVVGVLVVLMGAWFLAACALAADADARAEWWRDGDQDDKEDLL
jgi:hypothetical protein